MIILVDESFKKDFKRLKDSNIQKRIIEKLDAIKNANNIYEISNIKLMRGFPDFYRIRVGEYRIGMSYKNNVITLICVRSRKDIYNIFP